MTDWTKAQWRKSTVSDSGGCVEVAYADGLIGVRDTKAREEGSILTFNEHEWSAFLGGVARGEFTLDSLK